MQQKHFITFFLTISVVLAMSACGHTTENNEKAETNNGKNEIVDETTKSNDASASDKQTEEDTTLTNDDAEDQSDKTDKGAEDDSASDPDKPSEKDEANILAEYSAAEIEYARVWLQLGDNQEMNGLVLGVEHIPAGTALNPNDDTTINYPEDVVQIRGTRIVDGVVTYSSNGDGTINVYDIPYRWYGNGVGTRPDDISKERVEAEMKEIINGPREVYVNPNEADKVEALIKHLEIY